jgi:hypothetical protein
VKFNERLVLSHKTTNTLCCNVQEIAGVVVFAIYSYMEHLLSICGQRKIDDDRFYPFVPLRENAHAPKCRQPKAREFSFFH